MDETSDGPEQSDIRRSKRHKRKKSHKHGRAESSATGEDILGKEFSAEGDPEKAILRYERSLQQCRDMFRREVIFLRKEVDEFRETCQKQIEKQRRMVEKHKAKCEKETGGALKEDSKQGDKEKDWQEELQKLQKNMGFLERHQSILDHEQQLLDKEEELSARQQKMTDYEKEIEEVERMLDKRQEMCEKRSKDIEDLNDEVLIMRRELESARRSLSQEEEQADEHRIIPTNDPEASERARSRWNIVKRNLVDKVSILESTVQKYRTELATKTTTITAKEMMISKLNQEVDALKEEVAEKEQKIRQLDSQLVISIQEARTTEQEFNTFMDELQNIDLSSSAKSDTYSPFASPKKQNNQNHVKASNPMRRFLRRQSSSPMLTVPGGAGSEDKSRTNKLLRGKPKLFSALTRQSMTAVPDASPNRTSRTNGDVIHHSDGNINDVNSSPVVHSDFIRRTLRESETHKQGSPSKSLTINEGSRSCSIM